MPERLSEQLVASGRLVPAQADEALARQIQHGGTLDSVLLELGLVDEPTLLDAMRKTYGLRVAEPGDATRPVDPRTVRLFPEPWAKKHLLAPLFFDAEKNQLLALSPAPADVNLIARLSDLLEISVKPRLAPAHRVWQRLALLYDVPIPERVRALTARLDNTPEPHPLRRPRPIHPDALTFSDAVDRLQKADGRDDIARITLLHAKSELEYAALFICHSDYLEGWMASGPNSQRIPGLELALTSDSAFRVVLETHAHYLGPLPSDAAHDIFLEHIGRPRPNGVLIVPIRIRNRTVAMMYGEHGDERVPPRLAADLMLFVTHVQMALEALLLRRKASWSRLPGTDVTRPETPRLRSAADAIVPAEPPELETPPAEEPPEPGFDGPPPLEFPVDEPSTSLIPTVEEPVPGPSGVDTTTWTPSPDPHPAQTIEEPVPQPSGVDATTRSPSNGPRPASVSAETTTGDENETEPLFIEDDEGWTSVDMPAPSLGAVLDATISEAREALQLDRVLVTPPLAAAEENSESAFFQPGPFEARLAGVPDESEDILKELGALAESLVVAQPSAPDEPEDPEDWEEVDVGSWDDSNPPTGPVPTSLAVHRRSDSAAQEMSSPDLSAEVWLRASAEITRSKQVPREVLERAQLPEAPDPVPLTRISRPISLSELEERTSEDETTVEPIPLTRPASTSKAPRSPTDSLDDEPPADEEPTDTAYPLFADEEDRLVSEILAPPELALSPAPGDRTWSEWLDRLGDPDPEVHGEARETVATIGSDALPYLDERFPGFTLVDPFRPTAELPPFGECGPLLALVERCGPDAHALVLQHLEHTEPGHRFFAVYFYGAVYVPDAIPRLIQRLHDEEPRICMMAARTLFSYREHADFARVLNHLHGRLNSGVIVPQRHASFLVGLFRDVTAVPRLIELLETKNRALTDVVEDALAEITKQQFRGSVRKWRSWWSKNQNRSRIEWLIEGLNAKDENLRRGAAEELRAVTGLDMGFDEGAPRRQREAARQRWLRWWAEQERPAPAASE